MSKKLKQAVDEYFEAYDRYTVICISYRERGVEVHPKNMPRDMYNAYHDMMIKFDELYFVNYGHPRVHFESPAPETPDGKT